MIPPKRLALAAVLLLTVARGQESPPAAPKVFRDFAVRRDGNAVRGREIFFGQDRAACAQCHSVDGSSSQAGPDLSTVGDTFPRRELIDAVLEPNATIAVGYGATFVETTAGETFYGVIKRVDAAATELIGADGRRVRLPQREIKAQRGSPLSLMPEGLHARLTLQEFTDLIEYLVTLRQPANSLAAHQGLPDVIAELARPVALRPFFAEEFRFPANLVRRPGEPRLGLVWFGQVPGSRNVFLAMQQSGKIWRMEKRPEGDTKTLFGDFAAEVFNERGPNGLLGLAFHPLFQENRKYYLQHQVFEQGRILTVLVEKRAAPDLSRDSGVPSRRLLAIECVTENHTGGCVAFGPDGFLYFGMGDTGPQEDPNGHGQDPQLFLGKMLRLDVDRQGEGTAYAIPADNPFRGDTVMRPEIWALGFREPWRFSFDRLTGDLWVGDVGQNRVEEVAIVRRGENHGWNVYEGFEPFSNVRRQTGATYVPPIFAYKRPYGNSITGGHVYRGDRKSSFYGVYICGDFTSKFLFGLTQEDRTLRAIRKIGVSPETIASLAEDEQGDLYVVGYEGMIFKLDLANAMFDSLTGGPVPSNLGK